MRGRLTGCVLSIAAVVGLGACQRGAKSERACDQSELAALAKELDAAKPEARVALVAAGLPSACGDSLYPTVQHYLRDVTAPDQRQVAASPPKDKAFLAAKTRLCPEHETLAKRLGEAMPATYGEIVYETCGLDRYELMTRQEARELGSAGWMTWATHEMLITNGTPPEVARSISRALRLFEQVHFGPVLITPLDGQRLAKVAGGGPVPEGVPVYASMTKVVINERSVATLEAGVVISSDVQNHLIGGLHMDLREEVEKAAVLVEGREEPGDLRVLAVLDERLPFGTVINILYTAGRAGFRNYGLIVEPSYPVKRAILVDPPKFGSDRPPGPQLTIFINDTGYRVLGTDDEPPQFIAKLVPEGTTAAAWDRERLSESARVFAEQHPDATVAAVTAEKHITVDVLMSTYAALLGPNCKQSEGTGCVFPVLVIKPGAE